MDQIVQQALILRKWYAFSEETLTSEAGVEADGAALWKHAVAAVVRNPFAGQFGEDLTSLIDKSVPLGREFGNRLVRVAGESGI